MQYYISPNPNWENFLRHEELIKYLFAIILPWVNEGNWKYLNFTANSSIFEDPNGNTISLVFLYQSSDNQLISEIQVRLGSTISDSLQQVLTTIQQDFQLERVSGRE